MKSKVKSLAGATWQWKAGHGKSGLSYMWQVRYASQRPEVDPEEELGMGHSARVPPNLRGLWRDGGNSSSRRVCARRAGNGAPAKT